MLLARVLGTAVAACQSRRQQLQQAHRISPGQLAAALGRPGWLEDREAREQVEALLQVSAACAHTAIEPSLSLFSTVCTKLDGIVNNHARYHISLPPLVLAQINAPSVRPLIREFISRQSLSVLVRWVVTLRRISRPSPPSGLSGGPLWSSAGPRGPRALPQSLRHHRGAADGPCGGCSCSCW